MNQESFLKMCCDNSYFGKYIFVVYLGSLDRDDICDLPLLFMFLKKVFFYRRNSFLFDNLVQSNCNWEFVESVVGKLIIS